MKKIFTSLWACLLLVSFSANAQKLVSPDRAKVTHKKVDRFAKSEFVAPTSLPHSVPVAPNYTPSGKTAGQLTNLSTLGRASNVFTILRTEQNQVYANDTMDMVAFIHRQDVTIWGGGTTNNGKLRYDVSINRGANWGTDVGALQTQYSVAARYPQMTGLNPLASDSAKGTKLAYFAAALNSAGNAWDGYVAGVSEVKMDQNSPPTATENYVFQGKTGYLPGGLCEGKPGEYWTVSRATDGAVAVTNYDSTMVYKGVWNSNTQDIDWTTFTSITLPHNAYNNEIEQTGTNIAFSPDGETGWICMLADLQGGLDTVFSPVFIKSTDGGNTWGAPYEVNLSSFQHIVDSINFYVVVDSASGDTIPAGSGIPTTAFDCDIVVDANGNPHMVVVIGNGTNYSIQSGLWKGVYDITTTDGGTTWEARFISPCLTFRGEHGIDPQGNAMTMDNHPQASRSQDGKYIFYSWTDSDTMVVGYLEQDNLAPNLMISGYRITDNYRTCNYAVNAGDILWDGKALWPTMAPTVLGNESDGSFNLPIVFANMLQNDPSAPTQFHYIGNDAAFCMTDFQDPTTLNLGWTSQCNYFGSTCIISNREPVTPGGVDEPKLFPNPNQGLVTVRLPKDHKILESIEVFDLNGRLVHQERPSQFGAGSQDIDIVLYDLLPGIYTYRITTDRGTFAGKMSRTGQQ